MRTRWEEETGVGSRRFFGLTPLALGMTLPVAFIAGAAVMSYVDQADLMPAMLESSAPVVTENAGLKADVVNSLVADRAKWEAEAKTAKADVAKMRMQIGALRNQLGDEIRRRNQAELAVVHGSGEVSDRQPVPPPAGKQSRSAIAAIQDSAPLQSASPHVEPAPFVQPEANQRLEPVALAAAPSEKVETEVDTDPAADALQRMVEDTAMRSAAQSDKSDDIEVGSTSNAPPAQLAKALRSDSDVETALADANGIEGLAASERSRLKEGLMAGECVSSSLEKVFGRPVPVVPLRNLVRDLDSDC